jgi:hypothetical protein
MFFSKAGQALAARQQFWVLHDFINKNGKLELPKARLRQYSRRHPTAWPFHSQGWGT